MTHRECPWNVRLREIRTSALGQVLPGQSAAHFGHSRYAINVIRDWRRMGMVRTLLSLLLAIGMLGCSVAPVPAPRPALPPEHLSGTFDVILLPTEDFSFEFTANLARILSNDTGLKIRAMLNLGTSEWKPYPDAAQYDPAKLVDIAMPAINQLLKTYGSSFCILLTTKDINSADRNLRYVFAESYRQDKVKVSVISVARMVYGAPGQQASDQIIGERIRKMTLRTIGLQYFSMPRSANPQDIMYSPLMSLDALDALEPVLRR